MAKLSNSEKVAGIIKRRREAGMCIIPGCSNLPKKAGQCLAHYRIGRLNEKMRRRDRAIESLKEKISSLKKTREFKDYEAGYGAGYNAGLRADKKSCGLSRQQVSNLRRELKKKRAEVKLLKAKIEYMGRAGLIRSAMKRIKK